MKFGGRSWPTSVQDSCVKYTSHSLRTGQELNKWSSRFRSRTSYCTRQIIEPHQANSGGAHSKAISANAQLESSTPQPRLNFNERKPCGIWYMHYELSTCRYHAHSLRTNCDLRTCTYYVHSTCSRYNHSTVMCYDHSTCIYYEYWICMYYDHKTCMYYDHALGCVGAQHF